MFESANVLFRLRDRPTEDVEAIYARAEAIEARGRHLRLLALAVLDERKVHTGTGAVDTEGWLAAESRLSPTTAHAQVRAARQLAELPHVADAAADGRLSWDQVDAVVQLADPESDARWAAEAPDWSPTALARAVRRRRLVTRIEASKRNRERELRWWSDADAGMVRFSGQLPDAEGSLFVKAIEREAERAGPRPDGSWERYEARCADALVALASQRLSDDADPDRALLVVHTPAAALLEDSTAPGSEIPDTQLSLSVDTVRRLACDATTQLLFEGDDGCPLGIGRKTRKVPRWMYRLLKHRDRACRFPGCDRTRALHAHHMRHWADGGPTDLSNLILLCPFHHRYLHERQWSVRGDPAAPGGLEFRSPAGRVLPPDRTGRHRQPPRAAATTCVPDTPCVPTPVLASLPAP